MSGTIQVIQKPWGFVRPVCQWGENGAGGRVEHAHIVAGGYSSIHLHVRQHNVFQVLEGKLTVRTFGLMPDNQPRMRWEGLIGPGSLLTAFNAGEVHQFDATHGECVLLEIYTPLAGMDCSRDDIVRFSDNGVRK